MLEENATEVRVQHTAPEALKPEKALGEVTDVELEGTKIGRPEVANPMPHRRGTPPMFGGPPGMTGMGGPPGMVSVPRPPMPHIAEPHQLPPEMAPKQQQKSPHILRDSKPSTPAATMQEGGLIQLDPVFMLEIELVAAEERAAGFEEKLAERTLRDTREKLMSLQRKRSMLLNRITTQLNLPPGGSLRLVDKEQRICKIEK